MLKTQMILYIGVALILTLMGVGLFAIIFRKTTVAIANGYFSRNSTKNDYNGAVEKDKRVISKLPSFIFGGMGLLLVFGSPPFIETVEGEIVFIAIVFIIVYFIAIYVMTMNLIAIYCKERFRSFNLSEEGHLYPWGSGDRLENKNRVEQN